MTHQYKIGTKLISSRPPNHDWHLSKYMRINRKSSLLVISAIALICLLRFAFFYDAYLSNPDLVIDPDTKSYIDISTALYEDGRYERVPGHAEIHRPPGYPIFLAVNYTLFGQHNLLAPVILQHILFFTMMLMVAYLAFQIGGPIALTAAVGLYALDFTTFYYVNEILSELLFTFFVALALISFNSAVKSVNRQGLWFFYTGMILSAAIFVRPIGLYLMYPIAAFIAIVAYLDSEKLSHAFKSSVLFLLPWLIFGGAWYYYSYTISGKFTFTSYESEVFDQRLAAIFRTSLGIDIDTAYQIVRQRMIGVESPMKTYFVLLSEHPWAAIKEIVADIGRQLLSPGQWYLQFYFPGIFENQFPLEKLLFTGNFSEIIAEAAKRPVMYLPAILFIFAHMVIIYFGAALSILGIRKLTFENLALYVFMILIIGYFVGITLGFIGHSRFRVPFMPALVILSGYGFSLLLGRNKSPIEEE